MKSTKRTKLEKAGWRVGATDDFLELTEEEASLVMMKLALAKRLKAQREKLHLSQTQLAQRIGSSQSRVAKMEIADLSVSLDLLIRALLALGTSRSEIGKTLGSRATAK